MELIIVLRIQVVCILLVEDYYRKEDQMLFTNNEPNKILSMVLQQV